MRIPKPKIPLLIIAGPTAAGKTAVALDLAQKLKGEIVSADSMQVYKYMDIGTAKVSPAEQLAVRHHLLNIAEPNEEFSLAQYKERADAAIRDIWQRQRLPLLVGGTGLYIKAVSENYPLASLPYDAACRAELNALWQQRGEAYMLDLLKGVDPESAAKAKDRRRIIRALEVYRLTGKSQTAIQRQAKQESPYSVLFIALSLPRQELYRRIDARAVKMVNQGLVGEYIRLQERGYSPTAKAMQGLGYYHAGMFVHGSWRQEEMLAQLQRDTRRYAKRQLSWFRGVKTAIWLDNIDSRASSAKISELAAGYFCLARE